jgi:excinuclease ABC subunit A
LSTIEIRGARVHNLQNIDLDIPRGKMTVITGVSGSGKSSLAFDTLYAEGQRQYIDSLSAYARQFLDQIPRPDVDSIDGLAPTLAIDQKNTASGSRSTVATITEIYDYLRLLFARAGTPHCTKCNSEIATQSPDAIADSLLALPEKTKLVILAPMVRGRKGAHQEVFETIQKAGLVRARVDGEMHPLEEIPTLAPRKNHTIEAVIDRLVLRDGIESRLRDSVALALRLGDGLINSMVQAPSEKDGEQWQEALYSTAMACPDCGTSFAEVEPRTFSFNSPYGACPHCEGLGRVGDDADQVCPQCEGSRLCVQARRVTIAGCAIQELTAMPLSEAGDWLGQLLDDLNFLAA